MEDLINKELLKIMWLPNENEIFFHMRNEKAVFWNSEIYKSLSEYIDVENWKHLYSKSYQRWLDDDDDSIYDIQSEINKSMIDSLIKLNKTLVSGVVFYWFDIDRTNNENFKWEFCPNSKKRLFTLGNTYPKINSLISPEFPLVFPSQS